MRPVTWWGKLIFRILQFLIAFIIVFPILYAIDVSFMSPHEVFRWPPNLLPQQLNFANYGMALDNAPLLRYVLNSAIVSTCVMAGQMILASLAAFSFAYFNYRGKNLFFMMILNRCPIMKCI